MNVGSGTPVRERAGLSRLERILRVFTDVRAGEGITALLLFADVFLILNGYYVLKTVRESQLIGRAEFFGLQGDELKVYLSAGMGIALLGIIPAYSWLGSKVNRIKLLNITLAVVIGCLGVFFLLGRAGVPIAIPYFLWIGIVNVFLVAQFWSYANDLYARKQGERLFPMIAIGGAVGAIAGPLVAKVGSSYPYFLMLVGAGIFALCILLYNLVNRRERLYPSRELAEEEEEDDPPEEDPEESGEAPLARVGGFQLIWRQRYLLLIALMLLLGNFVNTTGEYILANAARRHAEERVPESEVAYVRDPGKRQQLLEDKRAEVVQEFYANFFLLVNTAVLLLQAFAVSRIFKYLGVRTALFFLPLIAFGGYALVGTLGGLLVLRATKTAENATDYSLQNTVRQALFLPTSREAKYKAKAAIDTFFVRSGDALAALLVAVGLHVLAFGRPQFGFVNAGLALIWIGVAAGIARRHKRLTERAEAAA